MQRFMAVRVPSARVYEYVLHLSKALHDGADVGLEGTVFGARLRTVMAVVGSLSLSWWRLASAVAQRWARRGVDSVGKLVGQREVADGCGECCAAGTSDTRGGGTRGRK